MTLTPEWVKAFVEKLVDAHGYHFKIGKLLATAIVKWSIVNPLHSVTPTITDEEYTARILSTITSYESSNRVNITGDSGKSYCAMQVQKFYGYKPDDLLKDASKCVEVGLKILHESESYCPGYPLAMYAQGNCTGKSGIQINDTRIAIAISTISGE